MGAVGGGRKRVPSEVGHFSMRTTPRYIGATAFFHLGNGASRQGAEVSQAGRGGGGCFVFLYFFRWGPPRKPWGQKETRSCPAFFLGLSGGISPGRPGSLEWRRGGRQTGGALTGVGAV